MYQIKSHKLLKDGQPVAWVPTTNKGGVIKPIFIVLHDTASPLTPQGDISWLSGKGNRGSSAHFVVARDGKITQLANTNIKTWHAGASKWKGKANCNDFTIGIEIDNPGKVEKVKDNVYKSYYGQIHDDDNVDFAFAETPNHGKGYWAFYSTEQIEAVVGMCQAMIAAYDIQEIITHWMISPGRKVDTNPLFPLDQVRERSFGNKDVAPPAASGWDAPKPVGSVTPPAFLPDATVTVDNLNLRAQPAMGDNIIAILNAGTRVDVQALNGNWYQVKTIEGKGGFLYKSFVDLD